MHVSRTHGPRRAMTTLLAAIAVYSAFSTVVAGIRAALRHDASSAALFAAFGLMIVAPAAAAAYFCHRRRDRDLFMVAAAFASMVILFLATTLPRDLGLDATLRGWAERYDASWIMLFVSLALLIGPFWLCARFLKACSLFAARRISNQ